MLFNLDVPSICSGIRLKSHLPIRPPFSPLRLCPETLIWMPNRGRAVRSQLCSPVAPIFLMPELVWAQSDKAGECYCLLHLFSSSCYMILSLSLCSDKVVNLHSDQGRGEDRTASNQNSLRSSKCCLWTIGVLICQSALDVHSYDGQGLLELLTPSSLWPRHTASLPKNLFF